MLKGSSITVPVASFRIGSLTLLTTGMLILIYYRCQLNAGLNVRILDIPIKSWEDVLASDKDFLIWRGTSLEDAFLYSHEGNSIAAIIPRSCHCLVNNQIKCF